MLAKLNTKNTYMNKKLRGLFQLGNKISMCKLEQGYIRGHCKATAI